MSDMKLDQIALKLDALTGTQTDIKVSIGKLQTHSENHQDTMERFWSRTWPGVVEKLDSNNTRIAQIEVDLAKIKTTVLLWGSFITSLIAISIPFISYLLEK